MQEPIIEFNLVSRCFGSREALKGIVDALVGEGLILLDESSGVHDVSV